MNNDLTQCPRECESQRSGALTAIGLRFKALAKRFPSASQGLLSIVDQAIVSGTSFLTVAIIARTTAPDELGLYYLILSIVIIVSAIQDNVVSAPYMVYSKRHQACELAEYSGSTWIHYLALSAVTVVGLLATIVILSITGRSNITPGLWALLGAAPFILLRQGIRRFAYANLHVKSTVVLDAVVAVSQLGGLALIGHFGWLSLPSIFGVMGGACALASLGSYLLDPPPVRLVAERFIPDWRRNWAFAKWSLRSYLVGNTTPYVMLWILDLTVGAASAGVLGACATLIGMTNVLLTGLDNVLTPQAAHALAASGAAGLRRTLSRTGMFLVVTLGAFCCVILAAGDWPAVAIFGAAYQGTGAILFTLALGTLMNSIGVVAGNGLWAIDRPRSNFFADVACMFATLIAAALLIIPFGTLGAALATLAGMTAAAVVRTITLLRYLRCGGIEWTAASRVDAGADARGRATETLQVARARSARILVPAAPPAKAVDACGPGLTEGICHG